MFLFSLQALIRLQTHHRRWRTVAWVCCSLRRESAVRIGPGSYLLEYWWGFSRKFPIDASTDFWITSASWWDSPSPFFCSWTNPFFARFWRSGPQSGLRIHRDSWSSCHLRLITVSQEWFRPQRDPYCRQLNAWNSDELQGRVNWWFVWNCTTV